MSHAARLKAFKLLTTIGGTYVWQLKDAPGTAAFFFESGLELDVDGAPKAYGPTSLQGTLDRLGNAGRPGQWWGVVTDGRGQPVVQDGAAPRQPYAGFYIAQTSLVNYEFGERDVRRFADATRIPYVALPPSYFRGTGLNIGDFALLINGVNGKYTFAVFADVKNTPTLGEVSICAAIALGDRGDPRRGSTTSRGIISLVFPNSGIGQASVPDPRTIAFCGKGHLQHFARYRDRDKKLPAAFPEYPHFATALASAGYED